MIDDKHITVEHDIKLGVYYVYMRLPAYDIESIKRGLRQQVVMTF